MVCYIHRSRGSELRLHASISVSKRFKINSQDRSCRRGHCGTDRGITSTRSDAGRFLAAHVRAATPRLPHPGGEPWPPAAVTVSGGQSGADRGRAPDNWRRDELRPRYWERWLGTSHAVSEGRHGTYAQGFRSSAGVTRVCRGPTSSAVQEVDDGRCLSSDRTCATEFPCGGKDPVARASTHATPGTAVAPDARPPEKTSRTTSDDRRKAVNSGGSSLQDGVRAGGR